MFHILFNTITKERVLKYPSDSALLGSHYKVKTLAREIAWEGMHGPKTIYVHPYSLVLRLVIYFFTISPFRFAFDPTINFVNGSDLGAF